MKTLPESKEIMVDASMVSTILKKEYDHGKLCIRVENTWFSELEFEHTRESKKEFGDDFEKVTFEHAAGIVKVTVSGTDVENGSLFMTLKDLVDLKRYLKNRYNALEGYRQLLKLEKQGRCFGSQFKREIEKEKTRIVEQYSVHNVEIRDIKLFMEEEVAVNSENS